MVHDALSNYFPGPSAAALIALVVLYLWGVARAYRAAGDGWSTMDRDVRVVFLLTVPVFQAAVAVMLCIDRLFYTPGPGTTAANR
jgi:hypothetical protein